MERDASWGGMRHGCGGTCRLDVMLKVEPERRQVEAMGIQRIYECSGDSWRVPSRLAEGERVCAAGDTCHGREDSMEKRQGPIFHLSDHSQRM